jgi:hypothetical protein
MRYDKKQVALNRSSLYKNVFNERGVKYIEQYSTPKLIHPTVEQIENLKIINHLWKPGDKYYKLAHSYYDDPKKWWIIAWFNKAPTESHLKIGETVYVPMPLREILKIYQLYY